MTTQMKFGFCILLAGVAISLTPAARADEWDKKTVMTFNEPVEIPGKVLPAGTYVFKLADSSSDRTIVQVFTADEKEILATILTIPDYRIEPTGKTVVTFEERSAGSPEALHAWYYPGDNYGIEFVYPKTDQPVVTHERPALVAVAPAPAPTPAPAPAPEPEAEEPTPPPAPVATPVVVQEEETVVVEQTEAAPAPTELPTTASNYLLFPLIGIALLAGGFAALRLTALRISTRQS